MRYRLIVRPEISRVIGGFNLGRDALVRMFNTLYRELEEHTAKHRHRRDPNHPDLYFFFELTVWDQNRPRGFRFSVDDGLAPDRLFLVAAEEI